MMPGAQMGMMPGPMPPGPMHMGGMMPMMGHMGVPPMMGPG